MDKKIKFKRVRSKLLMDCDIELIKQFRKLNDGWRGNMLDTVNSYRFDIRTYVSYILDDEDKLAAWSILIPDNHSDWKDKETDIECSFFTRSKFRRMGLGTKLVKASTKIAAEKLNKRIDYFIPNGRAVGFFKECLRKGILNKENCGTWQ